MALTNKQVIDSLISYYKGKGEDMTYLLEDPLFTKMPVQDQISAIKEHAEDIRNSSPRGLNKVEKAELKANLIGSTVLGLSTGALGVGAGIKLVNTIGIPIAEHMRAHRLAATAAIGGSVLAAGLISGALGYTKSKQQAASRHAIRSQLLRVQNDPNDSNAIGVLATKSQYQRDNAFKTSLMSRIHSLNPATVINNNFASSRYQDVYNQNVDPFRQPTIK